MDVTAPEIRRIRTTLLHWNQAQLALMLGVHPLTVSKWERDALRPAPYQRALLLAYESAAEHVQEIGRLALERSAVGGIPEAMYLLLRAAYDPQTFSPSQQAQPLHLVGQRNLLDVEKR